MKGHVVDRNYASLANIYWIFFKKQNRVQVLSDCDIIFKPFLKSDKILRLYFAFNQLIMFMCFIESPSRYCTSIFYFCIDF